MASQTQVLLLMPDERTEGKLKRNFKKIIIVVFIALIIS